MDFYSGFLRSACLAGLARLRPVVDPKYQARLDRELSAVSGTGAMDFFLLANDLTAFLRDSGLPRAHCPGKASASLVLYALGLTRLDPIDMGIRFRHFHSGRAWPPPPLAFEVESRHMPAVASWLARRSGPPWALRILEMPSGSGGSSFLTLRRLLRSDGFLEEECEILEHALVIGRTGHLHAEFLELEAYGFTPDRLDRLRSLIRVADGLVTGWADCTRFLLRYVLCHGPASPLLPCRPATPVPGIRVGTTWQRLAETGVAVFDLRARN
jgi:hypothetical protein